jgi:hypothetical protein
VSECLDFCGGARDGVKREYKFTYKGVVFRVVQAEYASFEVLSLCKEICLLI